MLREFVFFPKKFSYKLMVKGNLFRDDPFGVSPFSVNHLFVIRYNVDLSTEVPRGDEPGSVSTLVSE